MKWSQAKAEAFERVQATKAKGEPLRAEDVERFSDLELLQNGVINGPGRHELPDGRVFEVTVRGMVTMAGRRMPT